MYKTSVLLSLTALQTVLGSVPWVDGQISTDICAWDWLRAAIVRDTIYLDGGNLWWQPKSGNEEQLPIQPDPNWTGTVLTWNLSMPFDSDTNKTEVLFSDTLSKARDGKGNSNGGAPNFWDGGLLYNDAQFLLYGGLVAETTHSDLPHSDNVLGYQAYEYGADRAWEAGWDDGRLDNDVTRYIAYGAAVSAPSENKAWYFSGLQSPSHGELTQTPTNDTIAKNISNYLIEVDMEVQGSGKWTNHTLPSAVKGRASAEAVWVPVGEQGILVILGGVTYPAWTNNELESDDPDASKKESPKFMQEIDIYDIANDEWYKQPTKDGPSTRTKGCAVVARASDDTSFNIYYYGGFNGIDQRSDYYDDVWVLSLPTFSWIQLSKGEVDHGRRGHRCFSPAPNQMMVFGGRRAAPGGPPPCLIDGPVLNFNLTSGKWLDSYDPGDYYDYGVPKEVFEVIGGDARGGGDTEPKDGFESDELKDLFSTSYNMSKIEEWGPFPAAEGEKNRPNLPNDDGDDKKGGGLPGWVAPVLGVILGLIVVTTAIVLFCLYRRRKIFKNRSSMSSTHDNGPWILSWIKGQSSYTPTEKAPTVTTTEDGRDREQQFQSPEMAESKVLGAVASSPPPREQQVITPEMGGTPIAELDNTSPPIELSDTGLSPAEIIQRHSHLGKDRRVSDPTYSSFSGNAGEINSTVSRSSNTQSNLDDPAPQPTPPLGGVRSMSEAIAEDNNEADAPEEGRSSVDRGSGQIPVSPPTAADAPGEDYITARAAVISPLRKSMFREEDEDVDKNEGGK